MRGNTLTAVKTMSLGLLVFMFVASGFAQSANSVRVKHKLGEVQVPKSPKKLVVFDIGSLETCFELGIPVYGGVSSFPSYLSAYQTADYKKFGNVKKVDINALMADKPDLIIISGRQSGAYDSLSMIAPTVFLGIDQNDYWGSFEQNVKTIAEIYGKEAAANEKLVALRAKRDLLKQKATADPRKALVVLQVRGNHTAYGPVSRFGFVHQVLGFQPADNIGETSHTGHRFEKTGYISKVQPEILFHIDRDSGVGGEKKDLEELLSEEMKQSPAYKNNAVVELAGNIWYLSGGGLISVDEKLNEIGSQLYGL